MIVKLTKIGDRDFLLLGQSCIPVDRIKHFDFNVPNGGASGHSVQILTDDPNDEFIYAFDNCDAIRTFLIENEFSLN